MGHHRKDRPWEGLLRTAVIRLESPMALQIWVPAITHCLRDQIWALLDYCLPKDLPMEALMAS